MSGSRRRTTSPASHTLHLHKDLVGLFQAIALRLEVPCKPQVARDSTGSGVTKKPVANALQTVLGTSLFYLTAPATFSVSTLAIFDPTPVM